MKYSLIVAFGVLFISYLTGIVTKKYFKLTESYFSFATPIGFLVYMAMLQIGYFFISLKSLTSHYYLQYTVIVTCVLGLIGIVHVKSIFRSIVENTKHFYKLLFVGALVGISLYFFAYSEINFRLDDINFYATFIPERIYQQHFKEIYYSYQGYYVYLSSLISLGKNLSIFKINTSLLSIGFIQWVPAMITATMTAMMIVDLLSFSLKNIKQKFVAIIVWILVVCIIYTDYWYFNFIHFGNTLRRIGTYYLLLSFLKYTQTRDFKYIILASIVIGGHFAISSSAFFIDAFMIYAYFIYEVFNQNRGYLKNCCILGLFLIGYIAIYSMTLFYIVLGIYVIIFVLWISKLDRYVEKGMNILKYVWLLLPLLACVISTTVLKLPTQDAFENTLKSRQFFDPINQFDMIPDLLKMSDLKLMIFNILFWISMLLIILYIFKKKNNLLSMILLTTLVCFFNPIVFKMLGSYVTGVAYYRITDIFYNGIYFIFIVVCARKLFGVKIGSIVGISILLVMATIKVKDFNIPYFNKGEDHSILYRTSQSTIELAETLDQGYFLEDAKEHYLVVDNKDINIVSQIYGLQYFSRANVYEGYLFKVLVFPDEYQNSIKTKVVNLLADRFSYQIIDTDAFERTFARRYPGISLPEADYEQACSLAFSKNVDYVILDAQYNYQLQDGLWPCSKMVLDRSPYRVLKMDYDYWQENIKLGYTKDYTDEIGK